MVHPWFSAGSRNCPHLKVRHIRSCPGVSVPSLPVRPPHRWARARAPAGPTTCHGQGRPSPSPPSVGRLGPPSRGWGCSAGEGETTSGAGSKHSPERGGQGNPASNRRRWGCHFHLTTSCTTLHSRSPFRKTGQLLVGRGGGMSATLGSKRLTIKVKEMAQKKISSAFSTKLLLLLLC